MIDINNLIYAATGFATCAHRKQKRKYTGEPYINHPVAVMGLLSEYTDDIEIMQAGLLHDVIEDTDVTYHELVETFGERVARLVLEVTDASTLADGNREARKAVDRAHLARSSPAGATIKLADLIDNTRTIVKYDPDFAVVYLKEKEQLLKVLTHGHQGLFQRALMVLREANMSLTQPLY